MLEDGREDESEASSSSSALSSTSTYCTYNMSVTFVVRVIDTDMGRSSHDPDSRVICGGPWVLCTTLRYSKLWEPPVLWDCAVGRYWVGSIQYIELNLKPSRSNVSFVAEYTKSLPQGCKPLPPTKEPMYPTAHMSYWRQDGDDCESGPNGRMRSSRSNDAKVVLVTRRHPSDHDASES